jgi:hypothetical protein
MNGSSTTLIEIGFDGLLRATTLGRTFAGRSCQKTTGQREMRSGERQWLLSTFYPGQLNLREK